MLVNLSIKFHGEDSTGINRSFANFFNFLIETEDIKFSGVHVFDSLCAFNSNVECHFLDSGNYKVSSYILNDLLKSIVMVYASAVLKNDIVFDGFISRPSSDG